MSPWHALQVISGLPAFPLVWQAEAGPHFEALKILCLHPSTYKPKTYPCLRNCRCWHRITYRHDGAAAIGACQCDPPNCPNIDLSIEEITPLEANLTTLGGALCQALQLDRKPGPETLPFTSQIGSWSADAIPAILTVLTDPEVFRRVVAELVACHQKPFILLAPTARHLDLACQNLLNHARAGFFPLETIVTLTDHGTLHAIKAPGELFAQFSPQPTPEAAGEVACQILALARALDAEYPSRKAPLYSVFFLYCAKERTVNQIARNLGGSRSLIFARLRTLAQKLGRAPADLRQYSAHFEKIEQSLSDPRARKIYRQDAAHGDASAADSED